MKKLSLKKTLLCIGVVSCLCQSALAGPVLSHISVESAASINNQKLAGLLKKYQGREIDAVLLQAVLDEVTRYYRKNGFPSASAYLPEQRTRTGSISVGVLTPKIGKVAVINHARLRNSAVRRLFKDLYSLKNTLADNDSVESILYRLADLNVFDIHGSYRDGRAPDELDLDIRLDRTSRAAFEIFTDNYGTKAAGRYRAGLYTDFRNLTSNADTLSLFAARSNEKQTNLSLGYEIPVNAYPTVLGGSFCLGSYELAGDYEILGAQGTSYTYELFAKQPLLRSRGYRLSASAGARYRDLKDEFKEFALEFKKHTTAGYLKLSGAFNEGHFSLGSDVAATFGRLAADDDYGITEEGSFSKINASLSLRYSLNDSLALFCKNELQLGSDNLESSEKFQATGPYALTAFNSSIANTDSGYLNSLGLAYKPIDSFNLTLSPHFDMAFVSDKVYGHGSLYGSGLDIDLKAGGFFANLKGAAALSSSDSYKYKDDYQFFVRLGYIYA